MEELKVDYIGQSLINRFASNQMRDLIAEYGSDAIAVFFLMENELYLHPEAKVPYSGTVSRMISGKLFLPVETVTAVLNRMLELNMLQVEEEKYLVMSHVSTRRFKATQISAKRSRSSKLRKNIKV